ncbi:MAG: TIR domain-containing protein [Bacteroidetes bacterium]|nr:TIR domain-containing protein [Bacteroidota bacterium]
MADIFISYSRKDLDQALSLVERLKAAGFDVWIDRHGIEGANSWSKEIANALESASIFLLLLSESSVASPNVSKELGVATLLQKRIVPLRLDRVELRGEFLYHLANLQYVRFEEFDALVSVLSGKPTPRGVTPAKSSDDRKSLMILPFDDLSPTADNGWFADGIVSEMISALSNVKSLVVTDPQTTKDFKRYKGALPAYAKEMSIRYFVHGDVRKFGDSIKITARLLDIATGDYLWQESMKGTMSDIFEIQEHVAKKVLDGLAAILSTEETSTLSTHGTKNTDAYELFLKACEYYARNTLEGFRLTAQLCDEAIRLEPEYVQPINYKALALLAIYRHYERDPRLLGEAERLCQEALRLNAGFRQAYFPLSQIQLYRGKIAQAEETAIEYIRKAPDDFHSHFTLAFVYGQSNNYSRAIPLMEEAIRLRPGDLVLLWNLVVVCDSAGAKEKCAQWAEEALPYFERYTKLHPDHEDKRLIHAALLQMSGRTDAAHAAATRLKASRDAVTLYNTACLFGKVDDKNEALATLKMSIETGMKDVDALKHFLADTDQGVASLSGTPQFEEVLRLIESLEGETDPRTHG